MKVNLSLFIFSLYILPIFSANSFCAEKFYIGVAVPLSGENQDRGKCYVQAMQIYCKQLNAQGGINGVPLELIVKDDQNDPEIAKNVSLELAQDKRVVAIVGHHHSPPAMAAAKSYDQEGVVAITPYASNPELTKSSRWVFSMMANDIEEGKFIAVYVQQILKLSNILVLYAEDNDFGSNLKAGFVEKAGKIGLQIPDTLAFDPKALDDNFVATKVSDKAKKALDGVAIFSHSGPGMKLVEQLRKQGIDMPIIGPHSFYNLKFLDMKEEYSHSVYLISPFLYELGNEIAQKFVEDYQEEFHEFPNSHAPLAYDCARILSEAIMAKGGDRAAIRDYLTNLGYETSLEGASGGVLYFDKDRNVNRDFLVSEVKDGRFKVCYTQLKEPEEPYILRQVKQRVKKGQLLLVDGVPYHVIDVVFIGIDFLRIDNISTANMSFQAEVFMWFKWVNPKLDPNEFYFVNGANDQGNRIEILKEDLAASTKYRCYRLTWTFSSNFDLRQFPFDKQTLNITAAHKNLNSTHILLALDTRHMTRKPVNEIPEEWEYIAKKMNTGLYRYDSTFGDPNYRMGKGHKSKIYFATATVDIELSRHFSSYIFTFFVPLAIIVLITILIFGIPISDLATRLSVAMTSLLSILVFQMTQRQVMPMVGYAMKSDYYFIISYIFILSLIFSLVATAALWRKERVRVATLIDRAYVFAGIPVIICIYLLVPWL